MKHSKPQKPIGCWEIQKWPDDKILKRTIAQILWRRNIPNFKENFLTEHLAEAIQYRSLDRENWGG